MDIFKRGQKGRLSAPGLPAQFELAIELLAGGGTMRDCGKVSMLGLDNG